MNCKIIATYFGPRRYFPKNSLDTMRLMDEVVKNEIDLDPGVDMDVIVVNHDFGNREVSDYLSNINGIKINRGKLVVLNRPWDKGIGMSYASYDYAYNNFRDSYDYWFFTEDDVLTILPEYYRMAKEQIDIEENTAFIGCHRCILEESVPLHAHSGCGLTKKKFLDKAKNSLGSLPYSKLPMPEEVSGYIKEMNRESFLNSEDLRKWYRSSENDGEIAFTNIYHKLGFSIKEIKSELPVVKVYQKDSPYYL